jgi:BirA family transcriptional regulator, biotin operon repressor / biotin---[acetyl-CoA-carboxylase] ligase
MDVCRELHTAGAGELLAVVADEQTAGRGRVGRLWFSPPGQAIYASILLTPLLGPRQANWLTMIGALAVIDAVEIYVRDQRLAIKWFNDVLLDGRKLAGVLAETTYIGDAIERSIVGIGLNVNTQFAQAPDDVRARASSLRDVLGRELDREVVLQRLLAAFEQRYHTLPTSPLADYATRLETLGREVAVSAGDVTVCGTALRVDEDGALIVLTSQGERRVGFGAVL